MASVGGADVGVATGGWGYCGQARAVLRVGLRWVDLPRVGHHVSDLIGCSKKLLRSGCNQGSSLGNEGMGGRVPLPPLHPDSSPPRFSTRFPKGNMSITVVESPKASTNGPVCKKKGSNKMEVLVY